MRFAPPGKIVVRIGQPMRFTAGSDPEQIAKELQSAVEGL